MKYLLIITGLLFNEVLFSQTPVLVKDINPGSIGSAFQSYETKQIKDIIYFITDFNGGRDIYSLKDDNVQFVSKICPGNCSAYNEFLFEYGGKLYFKKQVDSKINQLWVTDGTEASNKLVFEYNGSFKNAVIGNNNLLYLGLNNRTTFKDEIYISDGTTNGTKKIGTEVYLGTNDENFGVPIKYENGITFVNIISDTLKIFKYEGEILSLLAKIKVKTGSSINGLKSINTNDLVVLVHSDNASSSEVYRFNSLSKKINKELTLPFTRLKYPFLKDFNRDSLILYHFNGGHFILSGNPLKLSNITPYSHESFGVNNAFYRNNENVAYLAVEDCGDICWNFKVILLSENLLNKAEFDLEESNSADLIGYDQYVFYSSDDPVFKSGSITMFDIINKTSKLIFSFNQNFSSNSIKLLGVFNGKLYFFANLNQAYGKELYYIETGIKTSTKDLPSNESSQFKLQQVGSKFSISCLNDNCIDLQIRYLDPSGRVLKVQDVKPNLDYEFDDYLRGFTILQVTNKINNHSQSFKLYIP